MKINLYLLPFLLTILTNAPVSVAQTYYWQKLFNAMHVNDILYDGNNNIYFSDYNHLYRSTDLGETWHEADNLGYKVLAIDSSAILWAGSQSAIYKSTNQGTSWTISLPDVELRSLIISRNNWIWGGTDDGRIVYSSNGGSSWNTDTLTAYAIFSLASNSRNFIFAGSANNSIYRSVDLGNTWQVVMPGSTGISGIVTDSSDNIFAEGFSQVFSSTDDGNSWTEKPAPDMYNMFIDKYHRFYGAPGYYSADNWETSRLIHPIDDTAVYEFVDSLVFLGRNDGLYVYNPSYIPYMGNNYFPLYNGNKWQYSKICDDGFQGNFITSVVRDSVIEGKQYFILEGDINDCVRYDTSENILYLRWGADNVVMDYNLNPGSVYSAMFFNTHAIRDFTQSSPDYLSIFDSLFYTKGNWQKENNFYSQYYTWVSYSENVGLSEISTWYVGHGGTYGCTKQIIRAVIQDSAGMKLYSDHKGPVIVFTPVYSTNEFNINWSLRVTSPHTCFSWQWDVNFVDTVSMDSYYSNDTVIIHNEPIAAENTLHSDYYHIAFQLDSLLMKQGYSFYYKLRAVDKGVVPEYDTAPDTGYYRLVYTPNPASDEEVNENYSFELSQNYPNPFNPATKISFSLPTGMNKVKLSIYDMLGNEIAVLVNEEKPAGEYQVKWNASAFSSGVYFYRLTSGEFTSTKKLLLMK